MTHRERTLAVLNYRPYDRMPLVHFGFWLDTLARWAREGHVTDDEARLWKDGNAHDASVSGKLGFDFNWNTVVSPNTFLLPEFEETVLEERPDGFVKMMDTFGAIVLKKPGTTSIPSEVDHTLKTRADWEAHYRHRLRYTDERVASALVRIGNEAVRWDEGGLEFLRRDEREHPYGLFCGSLFGRLRNAAGLVGISYLYADDPVLYDEMIETVGELCYQCVRTALTGGARFDFGHFWEDICFRGGPLVIPSVFEEKAGPHYRRITELLRRHGVGLASVDCDGMIDALIPAWIENGVNVMFPIEVGTWDASIAPWRQRYGRELRGVGGMNKLVFTRDRAAVDAEIARLRPLVDLGGYIPCPDHRIAPDAAWDNVRYYCDRFRETFG
jgi:hypothetical protein